jgi:eukaryotic-like serine/threonine-protein kinase
MATAPVRRISGYEVEGELAQGGMGVVRLARQPELDRCVVLKTLRRDLADDPAEEERFLREARAAAALHHPNVVGVYDCFVWRGERFIAQEYVEGIDLGTLLEKSGALPWRVAALIALEMARGFEEIHAQGLVHRDLKPSNVLLGRGGQVKIADFGVALDPKGRALTRTGYSVGTPPYMSPEQILGDRLDARSDHFSFGVVLYEMLCGGRPFEEANAEEPALVRRIEAERYPSVRDRAPQTPRWVAAVVRVCLRSKPKQRFASTDALRRLLERRLGQPSPADCRAEIARWLAESGALPQPKARTRRVVRNVEAAEGAAEADAEAAAGRAPGAAPRWRVAALVLTLLGTLAWAAATTSFVEIERFGPWLARNDTTGPDGAASPGLATSTAARAEEAWARVRERVTGVPASDPAPGAPGPTSASGAPGASGVAGVAASRGR